ncbi:MAG TPA: hypothetical protein VNK43_07970 [Gemmatimonadales bacterium]|nr:hypothetical protein [Gemmatimonadales bacterium]
MRMRTRSLSLAALALVVGGGAASAQVTDQPGGGAFKWYLGGQGGTYIFRTPAQDESAMPMVGAHLMVTARRTAVLLGYEHGLGNDEVSQFTLLPTSTSPGATQTVLFQDLQKYHAAVMAFPFKGHVQPYVGLGFGILTVNGVRPVPSAGDPGSEEQLVRLAKSSGTAGVVGLLAGLQFRLGPFAAFGQYTINNVPQIKFDVSADGETTNVRTNLLKSPLHTFTGGLRISLGSAREDVTGGGY